MGQGKSKKNNKQLKVLTLGISGSGKSTFAKQMKVIHHGGFSKDEIETYKEILFQNIIVGMQELVKQAEKIELKVSSENRKHARFFSELVVFETEWDKKMAEKVKILWADEAVQETWKAAPGYQLQMQQMDYLMEHLDRFSSAKFEPTKEDILRARQRTTGSQTTSFTNNKVTWQLIDVGGQKPERKKWLDVLAQGVSAVIFFAGLDEYNMASAEERGKTKMELSMEVFKELVESDSMSGVCLLLFLNKLDLFETKINDEKGLRDFQNIFPDYRGGKSTKEAAEHVKLNWEKLLPEEKRDQLTTNIICALDTELMVTVFNAVKDNIFLKRLEKNRVNF